MAKANTTPEPRRGKGPMRKQSRPGKTVGKYERPQKKGTKLKITVILVLAVVLIFLVGRLARSGTAMDQMVRHLSVPVNNSLPDSFAPRFLSALPEIKLSYAGITMKLGGMAGGLPGVSGPVLT